MLLTGPCLINTRKLEHIWGYQDHSLHPPRLCGWHQKQCPSWKVITPAPFLRLLPGKP